MTEYEKMIAGEMYDPLYKQLEENIITPNACLIFFLKPSFLLRLWVHINSFNFAVTLQGEQ
jgi:hypothetical protein